MQAFFARCGLTPSARRAAGSTVFEAGPFELWCGDLFELPADVVDDARAVYDRASLVALPPELRRRYAAHLAALVPAGSVSFLITFVHDLGPSGGPPFSVAADEVASLFAPWFDVELIAAADVLDRNRALADRGVTTLEEELHVLRRRDGTIG